VCRCASCQAEAKAIVVQLFQALRYLNEPPHRIIHYDLKPGNVLYYK